MPGSLPECKQCGECCRFPGFVYVNAEDIRQASKFLNMDEESFIQKFTVLAPNRNQLCLVGENGDCVFLEEDRCSIYSARPAQCRDFPLRWGTCPRRPA